MKLKSLLMGTLIVLFGMLFAQTTWKSADVLRREQELKFRLAQQYERQGQIDRALKIYQELVDQVPGQMNYYLRYKSLLFRLNQYAELEKVITRFLEYNPGNDQAIIDQGSLFFYQGDTLRAERHWKDHWRAKNYSHSYTRTLFSSLVALQEYNRAEEIIRLAREYHRQEDLFAIELANLAFQRGHYIQSTREYLLFGRQNRRNYAYIGAQILRFPRDTNLFADVDSLIQQEIRILPKFRDLHKLRLDWLFRFNSYQEAYREVLIIEELDNYRGIAMLDFANDLLNVGEFRTAQETYTEIIEMPQFSNITPQALLGLADAFEKEMLAGREVSPFDYFYRDNYFFIPDYIFGIDAEDHFIRQAFAIYDSVIVSLPKSGYTAEALYRLGELRYRVLHDIDGAVTMCDAALQTATNSRIREYCIIRQADLIIARGALRESMDFTRRNIQRYEGSTVEKELAVRTLLTLYYLGDLDSVLIEADEVMELLGINDPDFNDVLEFINFIEVYAGKWSADDRIAFADFIKGELFIRQNKMSEAREVFKYLLRTYPEANIITPAKFRLLQLALFFKEKEAAENRLYSIIDSGDPMADQALFLMAEIAHYRDQDPTYAAVWYNIILEQYPNSFMTDEIRKRLRSIRHSVPEL